MSTPDEVDRPARPPHADIPDDELTPWQQFDRAAWQRLQVMSIRARVRDYAGSSWSPTDSRVMTGSDGSPAAR